MFQQKNDEFFNDMPNIFDIADDIVVVGYEDNGRDHDTKVQKVLQRCREVNLKLNKDKCHFRLHPSHSLRGDIKKWSTTRPTTNQSLHGNASPNNKKGAPDCSGYY